ncbi:MAG: hypothetical protein ACLFRG_00475 [Desulfococcaceae bacterium]
MANARLKEILEVIGEEYADGVGNGSRFYVEVDIGKRAAQAGDSELADRFRKVNAVVPLRRPTAGMKVRIDGRTFVRYARLESGIAVQNYVAREAGMVYEDFIPNDSMILNFA